MSVYPEVYVQWGMAHVSWKAVYGDSVEGRALLALANYARSQHRGGIWIAEATELDMFAKIVIEYREKIGAALPRKTELHGEMFTAPSHIPAQMMVANIRKAVASVKIMDIIAGLDPVRGEPEFKPGQRVYVSARGLDDPSGEGEIAETGLDGIGGDIAVVKLDNLSSAPYGPAGGRDGAGQSRRMICVDFGQLRALP